MNMKSYQLSTYYWKKVLDFEKNLLFLENSDEEVIDYIHEYSKVTIAEMPEESLIAYSKQDAVL